MNRTIVSVSLLVVASASQAALWNVNAFMTGLGENPPNGSPATGTFSAIYDDATKQITNVNISVTGLTSPITASHIHQAPAGSNGAVILNVGTLSGGTSPSGFIPLLGTLTVAQETALFANGLYYNVHTPEFPGGEIRDQLRVTAVPEPMTMSALALCLAAMARKRKAR